MCRAGKGNGENTGGSRWGDDRPATVTYGLLVPQLSGSSLEGKTSHGNRTVSDTETVWAALVVLSGYFPPAARVGVMLNILEGMERSTREAGKEPPNWLTETTATSSHAEAWRIRSL
jgi:hypothetical protein